MPNDLVAEAAAVSLVLFVGLVLCVPLVLAMVGTVERDELRPLQAAAMWMRRHRARHRRGRSVKAQWDIQLAHAGGRYEELPTLEWFEEISEGKDDAPMPGAGMRAGDSLRDAGLPPALVPGAEGEAVGGLVRVEERRRSGNASAHGGDSGRDLLDDSLTEQVPRSSIFDRLSDTDCFAAINWDIHRAVSELAVLQRDLWAKFGPASVGDWPMVLRLEDGTRLLREAGYGDG